MRTIVCEEPNRLVYRDTEMPIPKENEALVRIRRIGICGTDLHAYKGNQPFFAYPRILGHELAGELVEVPANERGLRVGDPVAIMPYMECGTCVACRAGKTNCCTGMSVMGVHQDGGMREYIAVPVTHLVKADGLTADQTAVVECLSIGAHAVRRAELRKGETALVIGAGPIGLAVMKFAKLAGATVIALDMNEQRLDYCKSWVPADHTVLVQDQPVERIRELTGGDFPTVVFDATGNSSSMEAAVHYVAHGGRLVYVGLVKSNISFSDPEFHKREMAIMGSRNATEADFEHVIGHLRAGEIDIDAFVTHRAAFPQMIEQFETWLRPDSGVIKAMVEL
jgi:2-desacetyl-2-hydroxyethyl bacteriochlorophyllide A dehydrogenase